jgi:hypothetical protein
VIEAASSALGTRPPVITREDVGRRQAGYCWRANRSFFDRTCEQHRDACDEALCRVLAFIGRDA